MYRTIILCSFLFFISCASVSKAPKSVVDRDFFGWKKNYCYKDGGIKFIEYISAPGERSRLVFHCRSGYQYSQTEEIPTKKDVVE